MSEAMDDKGRETGKCQFGTRPFSRLLAPLHLGKVTLANRMVMGSMHTRLEHASKPVERQAAFYEARAAGSVGLIITGGYSPDEAGRLEDGGPILDTHGQLDAHKVIVDRVQKHGARIVLQILHAGRYAKHDRIVGVSDRRSHINPRSATTV